MINLNFNKGVGLTEIIIVVAISAAIFTAIFQFGTSIFSFNTTSSATLSAQSDGRRVLKTIVKELRSASPSSTGTYPVLVAATSSITFFSNIDADALKEQIRYFLQNKDLKRGVIKPSGSPLTYNPANEQISTLVHDIMSTSSPIFEYFDNNYAGTTTPLVQPVTITLIRLVRITIPIEKDVNKSPLPIIVQSQVMLRNLKDNL